MNRKQNNLWPTRRKSSANLIPLSANCTRVDLSPIHERRSFCDCRRKLYEVILENIFRFFRRLLLIPCFTTCNILHEPRACISTQPSGDHVKKQMRLAHSALQPQIRPHLPYVHSLIRQSTVSRSSQYGWGTASVILPGYSDSSECALVHSIVCMYIMARHTHSTAIPPSSPACLLRSMPWFGPLRATCFCKASLLGHVNGATRGECRVHRSNAGRYVPMPRF